MSKNIVVGFSELRKFCKQASLLLRTASTMMEDEGWDIAKPAAVFEGGRKPSEPEWWLPYDLCRFFEKSGDNRLLTYIAINVGDPEEYYPIEYALLSAGCVRFRAGARRSATENWTEHWWSRWHLFMQDRRKDDGTPCFDEPHVMWPENDREDLPDAIESVTTLAYPLTDITGSEALGEKIVKPLLNLVGQHSASGKTREK